MNDFLKKNGVALIIVLATIILAAVAVFTALRLYQTRQENVAPNAPSSRPAAAGIPCANPLQAVLPWDSTAVSGTTRNYTFSRPLATLNSQYPQWEISSGIDGSGSNFSTVTMNGVSFTDTAQLKTQYNGDDSNMSLDYQGNWTKGVSFPGILQTVGSGITTLADPIVVTGSNASQLTTSPGVLIKYCPAAVPTAAPAACQTLAFTIATPSPTPSTSASPTPSPVPQCGTTCSTNSDCPSSMVCYVGVCRNPSCTTDSSCLCATGTPTPSPTVTATSTPIAQVTTSTPTPELPQAGVSAPTIMGVLVSAILIVGALILAL